MRSVVLRHLADRPVEFEPSLGDPIREAADDRTEIVATVRDVVAEGGQAEDDVRSPAVMTRGPELLDRRAVRHHGHHDPGWIGEGVEVDGSAVERPPERLPRHGQRPRDRMRWGLHGAE